MLSARSIRIVGTEQAAQVVSNKAANPIILMYFSFFISFLRYVIHLLRYTDGSGPSFRIHLFKVFFRFPVSGFHRSMQP